MERAKMSREPVGDQKQGQARIPEGVVSRQEEVIINPPGGPIVVERKGELEVKEEKKASSKDQHPPLSADVKESSNNLKSSVCEAFKAVMGFDTLHPQRDQRDFKVNFGNKDEPTSAANPIEIEFSVCHNLRLRTTGSLCARITKEYCNQFFKPEDVSCVYQGVREGRSPLIITIKNLQAVSPTFEAHKIDFPHGFIGEDRIKYDVKKSLQQLKTAHDRVAEVSKESPKEAVDEKQSSASKALASSWAGGMMGRRVPKGDVPVPEPRSDHVAAPGGPSGSAS